MSFENRGGVGGEPAGDAVIETPFAPPGRATHGTRERKFSCCERATGIKPVRSRERAASDRPVRGPRSGKDPENMKARNREAMKTQKRLRKDPRKTCENTKGPHHWWGPFEKIVRR
ncbi:hypothetical protein ACSDR0_40275 [Streptosporangium sp. G11]|uniref:hypothetical protein n=1 Tax=Streptosporangium sp. G11 TaxID=3436926 RepID=UPI003EB6F976